MIERIIAGIILAVSWGLFGYFIGRNETGKREKKMSDTEAKTFEPTFPTECVNKAFKNGRTRALSDAVTAVEKLRLPDKGFRGRNGMVDKAIAAIRALEGK